MDVARVRSASCRRLAGLVLACAALSACASSGSEDPTATEGLFKAEVGDIGGGVAPGPHSVWYVQQAPTHFVKMGFAVWRRPPATQGLRSWFGHLLGAGADHASTPTAVVSKRLGLPTPSWVQVINVTTGAAVMVRVDDRADLGDSIIRLAPATAAALEADASKPLLVRLRYMSPVIAYRDPPSLTYAFWKRRAPTLLAEQTAAPPPAAAPPAPQPALPVLKVADAGGAPPAAVQPAIASRALPLRGSQPAPQAVERPPKPSFGIQAGAFAKYANAEHAVAMLAPAGEATIVPLKRGALTLYRVVLEGARTRAAAEKLRARVAEIGFADARVIRPL